MALHHFDNVVTSNASDSARGPSDNFQLRSCMRVNIVVCLQATIDGFVGWNAVDLVDNTAATGWVDKAHLTHTCSGCQSIF